MGNYVLDNNQQEHGKRKSLIQRQSLENLYTKNKYPKQVEMKEYAVSLSLNYKQVRIWFSDRRRKDGQEKVISSCKKKSSSSAQELDCATGNMSRWKHPSGSKERSLEDNAEACVDGLFHRNDRSSLNSRNKKKNVANQRQHKALGEGKPTTTRKHKDSVQRKHKDNVLRKHTIRLQVLFSKEYILRRVFRKDGPPLGLEFDAIPSKAFTGLLGSVNHLSCGGCQRISKKRKVSVPTLENIPTRRYGMGKALMTLFGTMKTNTGDVPTLTSRIGGKAVLPAYKTNALPQNSSSRVLRRMQKRKIIQKHIALQKKQERKAPVKQKSSKKQQKILYNKSVILGQPHHVECQLYIENPQFPDKSHELITLIDDEELELGELQAGPNPLRCSVHIASNGRNGCPFCKDLLARFPSQTVKMKQPFVMRPWESSKELVKKLFKIVQFLYTNATMIQICQFTLDELAQAFHDKDSLLLGQIHISLLKAFLSDVQRAISAGIIPRTSKDCRFMGFLLFIRKQECNLKFWARSLSPLTWTEIMRQVLVAAGFGPKQNAVRRIPFSKERNLMEKFGLCRRTLKGVLFSILTQHGSGGLGVSELSKTSQIAELGLPNSAQEMDELIYATLSSDITLFEKIAPFAYRLRVDPKIKGEDAFHSDTDDSGSVDDDSDDDSADIDDDVSDDCLEMTKAICKRRTVKHLSGRQKALQTTINFNEIDESFSGETWILGLMEGEYSSLSIDEKLDALIALIDLTSAGSRLRTEEPIQASSTIVSSALISGAGGKIRKAMPANCNLSMPSREKYCDPSPVIANVSSKKQNSEHAGISASEMHRLQSVHLGSDRRFNRYWLFLGPCSTQDPGHRRIYFESSEDGHWEIIDTSQALRSLMSLLDSRGTREAHLFTSLERVEVFLCHAMDDYLTGETGSEQRRGIDSSEIDNCIGDNTSPISDIDNNSSFSASTNLPLPTSGAIVLEEGRDLERKKLKCDRLQAFDKWIWNSFYSNLNAVKHSKCSSMECLVHCDSCHDLYWRYEKHCKVCHTTFEVDFNIEEKYAIHVAVCREPEGGSTFPMYKVLPSQLQTLKASIHAIEAVIPEQALIGAWTKSTHNLWVKRLRRTSSLPELLQVLTDFVGSLNEEWLYENASSNALSDAPDNVIIHFQTLPQTVSAVALWMMKLDAMISSCFEQQQLENIPGTGPKVKRKRICSQV